MGRELDPKVADFIHRHALMPLRALDNTCPHCDYDEAEGALVNHCDACCRKIVRELWAYREGLRARIQAGKRAQKRKSARAEGTGS
jgi:hypothetical protein